MIVMKHEFIADYPDRREHLTSTLIDFGIPNGLCRNLLVHRWLTHSNETISGETSISRTVALPVAIAIRLVLEGKVHLTGRPQQEEKKKKPQTTEQNIQ
jgi:hypothetical protein